MANGDFVAYYRVSTVKQGASGLGLEAQQEAVRQYLKGGISKLVGEFTEVESGKKSNRPALQRALRLCRLHNAKLVVAKLDRLARNVNFLSSLMESKVDFIAVDFPEANRLTIHILSAVAEHEAVMISARTVAGLKALKARKDSKPLGGDRNHAVKIAVHAEEGRLAGLAVRQKEAADRALDLMPTIQAMKDSGVTSLRKIADGLNQKGFKTARGGEWSAVQVMRVLNHLQAA
jgi:DNA invertase Pin-like site-specific DNA recombinase